MFIAGDIKMEGPELEKKEVFFDQKDQAMEFSLNLDKAQKEKISFSIWLRLTDDEDFKISTDLDEDGIYSDLFFDFKTKDKNSIALAISYKQAKELKEILEAYLKSYEAYEEAKKKGEVIIGKYTEPAEEKAA